MHLQKITAQNDLTILNTQIRRDAEGRYCLNDCHKASGSDAKNQPSNWMRLDATKALIAELDNSSDLMSIAKHEGRNGGTFAAKELVYAYAMWINATFHLQVIRAFDALVTGKVAGVPLTREQKLAEAFLLTQEVIKEKDERIAILEPKADALDRIATADGSLGLIEAAKALQVQPKAFIRYLSMSGWIYRRAGSKNWLGYQVHTTSGNLEHKVMPIPMKDGSEVIREQVKITPRGLTKLAKIIPLAGAVSAAA